jgi:hypothetical protein
MTSFVDLTGASGAHYLFRAWADAGQTPMAGNFVVAETDAGGQLQVRLFGVTDDLSKVQPHVASVGLSDRPVFVRLNVARLTRRHEHDDLAGLYAGALVLDIDA